MQEAIHNELLASLMVARPRDVGEVLSGARLTEDSTLVLQIYEILREAIVSVQLRPRQRISEKEISEALNASKTPVREALIRLEEAGLVQVIAKSGTYVTPIRMDRYLEACFIRLQLETGAARRAAEICDAAGAALLRESIEEQKAVAAREDYVGFFQKDEAFHQAVFRVAGIAGAWHTIKRTQADMDRIRHLKRIYQIRRTAEVTAEHQAIADAIAARMPDNADAAMRTHIGSLDHELGMLAKHPLLLEYIDKINGAAPSRRPQYA